MATLQGWPGPFATAIYPATADHIALSDRDVLGERAPSRRYARSASAMVPPVAGADLGILCAGSGQIRAGPARIRRGICRAWNRPHAKRPWAMLGRDEQIAGEQVGEVIACGRAGSYPARSGAGRAADTSLELGL